MIIALSWHISHGCHDTWYDDAMVVWKIQWAFRCNNCHYYNVVWKLVIQPTLLVSTPMRSVISKEVYVGRTQHKLLERFSEKQNFFLKMKKYWEKKKNHCMFVLSKAKIKLGLVIVWSQKTTQDFLEFFSFNFAELEVSKRKSFKVE